jgi:uncharacterized protein (TIGR03435 family)
MVLSALIAVASAQAPRTPVHTSRDELTEAHSEFAFDVVSIRPSTADPNQVHQLVREDQYDAAGMPLGATILMAYFPFRMGSKDRIVGAPSWVWEDKYDFLGKIAESDLPAWQNSRRGGFMVPNPMLQSMLQRAISERCKLSIHRIPAQTDGFALVVTSRGPNTKNLRESKPLDAIPDRAIKISFGGRMVPIYSQDEPVLHFYQTSMASLALLLSGWGGLVVDKTGLTGAYRFDLTRLGTEGVLSDWDLAPLGLKLIPTKVLTENIVIDHIERPSPN